jgi:hypothetical protein
MTYSSYVQHVALQDTYILLSKYRRPSTDKNIIYYNNSHNLNHPVQYKKKKEKEKRLE